MDREQFEREYNSVFFTPNPNYEYAFKKWLEYYYEVEEYDRNVCTGYNKDTDDAIPSSTVEYIDINRNAKRSMNHVVQDFYDKSIDMATWVSARNEVVKYSNKKIKELLSTLNR